MSNEKKVQLKIVSACNGEKGKKLKVGDVVSVSASVAGGLLSSNRAVSFKEGEEANAKPAKKKIKKKKSANQNDGDQNDGDQNENNEQED